MVAAAIYNFCLYKPYLQNGKRYQVEIFKKASHGPGLTAVQILYVVNIRLNASLNPFTYGIVTMPLPFNSFFWLAFLILLSPLFCMSFDRESDKAGRLITEAIWSRKTDNMNRDEGSYQLSHVWDKLLHTDDRHRKSVLMKASDVKPKRR